MSQTDDYVAMLNDSSMLTISDKNILRSAIGKGPNDSSKAFDIFSGIWWNQRKKSPFAPRREVAWLIAKLFSQFQIPHFRNNEESKSTFAVIIGRSEPHDEKEQKRYRNRFEALLQSSLQNIETHLHWGLSLVKNKAELGLIHGFDWVQLTDDLSIWDRGKAHRRKIDIKEDWAKNYYNNIPKYHI
jgi:CRISPR type I-E-associated protein CasB/Cse2